MEYSLEACMNARLLSRFRVLPCNDRALGFIRQLRTKSIW